MVMARIRTFKPDFLRHEVLQDLEAKNPGKYPMFVFLGLWSACDKQGVFPWKPRLLKLDIYPFLNFDMEETLQILIDAGFIKKFVAREDKKTYGFVVNFEKHQRINGDESKTPAKYPPPQEGETANQERSSEEADEKHERSGEENGTRKGKGEKEREKELGKGNDAGFSENSGHEKSDSPSDHFIWHWQQNGDIFNPLASLKKPNDWNAFWEKSNITKGQIDIAMKNFIEAVKSGAIERRYIPANPDTFVLNGWIQKSQERYRKQGPPNSPGKRGTAAGKKPLGGLDSWQGT
jgi:hypothetical protein